MKLLFLPVLAVVLTQAGDGPERMKKLEDTVVEADSLRLTYTGTIEGPKLYKHPANQLIAQVHLEHIDAFDKSISRIETAVLADVREIPLPASL